MSNISKSSSTDTFRTPEPIPPLVQIKIIGILNTIWFQEAKKYALLFAFHLPNEYAPPEIIPYLEVEWNEYLLKQKRIFGGQFYKLKKPLIVYKDNEFLGDEKDLINYLTRIYQISVLDDFEAEATKHLKEHIEHEGRKHIFLVISIDNQYVGSLVFALYNDICPFTCTNFLNLISSKHRGITHSSVHRICKDSWIQFGGWKMKGCKYRIPCENYAIPHDRRGVLSMCHNGKHTDNSTQFFVTLNPTPWMDYLYCAFGQLVIGDDVLTKISNVQTYYECPKQRIHICKSGLYTFHDMPSLDQEKVLRTIFQPKSEIQSIDIDDDGAYDRNNFNVYQSDPSSSSSSIQPFNKIQKTNEFNNVPPPSLQMQSINTVARLEEEQNKNQLSLYLYDMMKNYQQPKELSTLWNDLKPIDRLIAPEYRIIDKKRIQQNKKSYIKDVLDVRDVESRISITKFRKGMYDFNFDM